MAQQPVIVNNPKNGDGSNTGVVVGVIVIIAIFLFFFYGLPRIRGGGNKTQINVPDKIQINSSWLNSESLIV